MMVASDQTMNYLNRCAKGWKSLLQWKYGVWCGDEELVQMIGKLPLTVKSAVDCSEPVRDKLSKRRNSLQEGSC